MTCHHGVPADGYDCYGDVYIRGGDEEFEQEAEGMQHATVAGDQKRPEIKAAMSLEGEKDLDVQFGNIVPSNGGKGGDCHERRKGVLNLLARRSLRWIDHLCG